MATRGKKVEIYYTSQGTTTGIDASALVFDGKNLNIYTHNKTFKGTDTTYDVFGPSGSNASSGLVPAPDNTAGSSKFLREDGTWAKLNLVNPYVGPTAELDASVGYINSTPGVGQGNKFFRSDGTWSSITKSTVGLNNVDNTSDASKTVAAAGKATNLAAGAAGSIPYQSASNTTAFLAAGSNGQILAYDSANNKPYWKDDNNTWKAANASQEGYVPKTTANKILRTNNDGAVYWGDDSNTWKAANTSQEGYIPKLATGGGTIATQASEYVLTFKSGTDSTPVWRLLPSNAYNDHTYTVNNNTYRIKSKIGDATTTISDFTANQASDDDFTLIQGSNITFTNDTTNRTITIAGTANTWKAANTSQEGYIPKLATGGGTIATQSTEYVLTFKSGTDSAPVWRLLPSNAYNDHTYTVNNNTYRIKSKIGDATTTLSDFTANQSSDDDFTLVQGSNITFTNDATNRTLTIAGTANTWKAANTSQEGYVPKLATGGGTIGTQSTEYVLTFKSGTDTAPVWRLLPSNAYNDHTYTVNNNTFRIKSLVGSTTTTLSDFTANQASDDDFTLVQGSNITFTVDATNRKLTIAGTANTWKAANASQEGYVPKSTANKILRSNNDGALYWGDDTNTWRPVGTGATDAAAGNHTHGISIATDSGTNQISLAAGTKYKLTAGGQSYIFTTPADSNTDTKVSQVDNNGDAARPILVKNGTGTGTVTDSALFADGVTVNPSSNSLSISGNLSVSGTASFSNNVTLSAGLSHSGTSGNFTWGHLTIYGSGSNGGINSMLIGDDVTIGDCNAGGIMGMKSTGANCGFRFFNSSGTNIGTLQSTAGTLQFNDQTIIHSGNISSQNVSYANSAGNADTVDSQHFKWSNDSNSPTYLWAANSSGTAFLAARASMSVNYANSAGSASSASSVGDLAISKFGIGSTGTDNVSNYYLILSFTSTGQYSSWSIKLHVMCRTEGGESQDYYVLIGGEYSSATSTLNGITAYTLDNYQISGDHWYYNTSNGVTNVYFYQRETWKNYTCTVIDYYNANFTRSNTKQSGTPSNLVAFVHRTNITSANIGSQSVNYATSAGSANAVAWANVSSKPASATRWPTWDEVTSKPSIGGYWNTIPQIGSDGVMEVGKYIDFHNSSNDGVDYAVRLQCQGNNKVVVNLPTSGGTLSLDGHTHTWASMTSKPAATGNATTPVYWNGSGFTNCTAYGSASVNYATSSGTSNASKAVNLIDNPRIEAIDTAPRRAGMDIFLVSSSASSGTYPPAVSSKDGPCITLGWDGYTSWGAQMHFGMRYNDDIHWRAFENGSWTAWKTVIDSRTIGSQSVNYATSAGSANAVAWDKVSSKPATATRWPSWSEVTSKPTVLSQGSTNVHDNTAGLLCMTVSNPASGDVVAGKYGSVLQWANNPGQTPSTVNSGNWYNQLFGLTDDRLYFRTRTNGGSWTSLHKIAWTSDIPSTIAWSNVTDKPASATRWPAWSEVTGKPSTFTPASHTHDYLSPTSSNRQGVYKLFRRDDNSNYSVQTHWTGTYWMLRGYNGDNYHAGCQVAYADSAGSASSASSVAWGNVTGKPSTFTPSSHTHDYLPNTGGTISGKLEIKYAGITNGPKITSSGNSHIHFFGNNGNLQIGYLEAKTNGQLGWYPQIAGSSSSILGAAKVSDSKDEGELKPIIFNNLMNNSDPWTLENENEINFLPSSFDSISYDQYWINRYTKGGTKTDNKISYIAIGNGAGSYAGVRATNFVSMSDRREKKNLKNISKSELEKLYQVANKLFKGFTWKDTNQETFGLIAQEIQKYIPEACELDEQTNVWTIDYQATYAKIMASIINEVNNIKEQLQSLLNDK